MKARRAAKPADGPSLWSRLERFGWLLALLACLPSLVPTLAPGWFEGHDDLHIYRLIEYDLALGDGQVPPRWFPDISAGFGNPHPIYYAPLFYIVAEVFHLGGFDVVHALKGAIVVFMLAAALGMYGFARPSFGVAAAVVASAAYTFAPYHLLDLYVRKAFSELTVFAVLPYLLLATRAMVLRGERWDAIALALSLAATCIAHTITTMMVPALVSAYALFLIAGERGLSLTARARRLAMAAGAAALGAAVAGFFLVPAFLERNSINLRIYTEAYVQYQKHFVAPRQLIWWPWGFGMSLDGLADQMSFRMGLLQIAGVLLAAAGLSRLKRRVAAARREILFWLWVTAAAVFMMLSISEPVWAAIPPLKFVQFPWRFLTLTTLSTSLLCGAALAAWGPPAAVGTSVAPRRRLWSFALALCALFAIASALGGTLGVNLRVPIERVGFEEKPYNNMIDRGPDAPPVVFDGEFVRRHTLRWIDHLPPGVGFMERTPRDLERSRVEVDRGAARVTMQEEHSSRWRFAVQADEVSRLRLNIYRFPGWVVRVDGAVVEALEPAAGEARVIFIEVGPGAHEVVASFESTWPRRLGDRLTLAGLALVAVIGLWPRRRTT